MIASSSTALANLAYLIGAVVLAVIGGSAVWLRHRKPKSVDANMASFRRGLSALAPDRTPRPGPPRPPQPSQPTGVTALRARPYPPVSVPEESRPDTSAARPDPSDPPGPDDNERAAAETAGKRSGGRPG